MDITKLAKFRAVADYLVYFVCDGCNQQLGYNDDERTLLELLEEANSHKCPKDS